MISQKNDPEANIQVRTGVSADGAVKHRFTKQHFRAASFFADSAAHLENEICVSPLKNEIRKPQHRAYVVGAIASAVMGLEACINEIYLDACDASQKNLAGLDESAMSLLALWWIEIERRPILFKYQHSLLLLGKPVLPKGESLYQDTESLIRLRNALTHYKPEWDNSLDVHGNLQSRLRGKFTLNSLSTSANLWFPHKCLGGGCARWAVGAAEKFVRTFCEHLGIRKRI
ncbi:hypothetical protein ACFLSZ_07575 [Candidatus Bipolaricaulota bacterium]